MTQTTTTPTTLDVDILRQLAFLKHEGEDYFLLNDVPYLGNHQELWQEWIECTENLSDAQTWDEFVKENCEEITAFDNDDYWVLTDEEADEKWEESLDSYIEECIQPEIDKLEETVGNLSYYIQFNEEMWKRDARMDGRGHSLSSYDGCENEETVEGQTFYIYRLN